MLEKSYANNWGVPLCFAILVLQVIWWGANYLSFYSVFIYSALVFNMISVKKDAPAFLCCIFCPYLE